jgi:large subunit ribosomal protein L25
MCRQVWLHFPAVSSERMKLLVSERAILGSAESRRLRRQGLIPGVLYGREKPHPIAVPERDLRTALTSQGGLNAVLDVVIDGGKAHSSVLKDYQLDRLRGIITHVDLQEVRLDQPIHATVPVHLVGEAIGSKEGGVVSQSVTEINVEALPMEIPASVDFDISELQVHEVARLGQIPLPSGVTLLDDPETALVSVTLATQIEEEPAEGEAAAEAEAEGGAAEPAAEAPAEPDASEE